MSPFQFLKRDVQMEHALLKLDDPFLSRSITSDLRMQSEWCKLRHCEPFRSHVRYTPKLLCHHHLLVSEIMAEMFRDSQTYYLQNSGVQKFYPVKISCYTVFFMYEVYA